MKKKILVMLCLICSFCVCGCTSDHEYESMVNRVETMKQEATEYENKISELESKNKELNDNYNSLKSDYDNLQEQYAELEEKYNEATYVEIEQPTDLSEYSTDITYDNIARTPDDYYGKAICFTGEVLQLIEGEEETQIRLAVDSNWNDIVLCGYDPNITSVRILEDDIVTVYGISLGITTYESTIGQTISVPLMYVEYIEIN